VVDLSGGYEQRDPVSGVEIIDQELAGHAAELASRPQILVGNKIDMPDTAEVSAKLAVLAKKRDIPYFPVSAVTGEGIDALVLSVGQMVVELREKAAAEAEPEHEREYVLRPRREVPVFNVARTGGNSYEVRGRDVERMVIMTELENEEAAAYLQRRLAKIGVEDELIELGAVDGDEVTIAGATFEFEGVAAPPTEEELFEDLDEGDM